MIKFSDFSVNNTPGGYISLRATDEVSQGLKMVLSEIGVDDVIEDIHITLMYDRSNPEYAYSVDKSATYEARVCGVELLGEPDSKWRAITLKLDSDEIVARHHALRGIGFKHSYDNFIPHLSLKYKPTDKDAESIKQYFNSNGNFTVYFTDETREFIRESD